MAKLTVLLNENYEGKKSNGQFPIVARVAHNGEKKFYKVAPKKSKTAYKVNPKNWDEVKEIVIDTKENKVPEKSLINTRIAEMKTEYIKYLQKCEANNITFDIEKVYSHEITDGNYTAFFKLQIAKYEKDGKLETVASCNTTLTHFTNWKKGKDVKYSDLFDNDGAEKLVEYLKDLKTKDGEPLKTSSLQTYFILLSGVYEKAILKDHAPFPNPFSKTDGIKVIRTQKIWCTTDEITKLSGTSCWRKSMQRARDMYLFSYYCRGMRFQNVLLLKKEDIREGRIFWVAVKSKIPTSMAIHPKIQEIIDRWMLFSKGQYLFFDKLNDTNAKAIKRTIHTKNTCLNESLRNVVALAGIEKYLTFHSARHSFSNKYRTMAKNISMIQDALGHASQATTELYLDGFPDEHLDKDVHSAYEE